MRIGKRELANLTLVAVVSVVALVWAAVGLAGVRFDDPKSVRVRLANAGGALPGAEVSYLGVPIGRVAKAELVKGAIELQLSVRPKGPMAEVLRADVRQKSSLGEPYVDLAPADPRNTRPGDPNGAVIPVERTSTPRPLHQLLTDTERILSKLDPADVAKVAEGFSGVVGHETDIQALLAGFADTGQVMATRRAEMGGLLSGAARLTATMDAHRDELSGAITGYARLGRVLANRTDELHGILEQSSRLGTEASDLLARAHDDLEPLLAGLDVTFHNLAVRPTKIRETMQWIPEFMERFSFTIDGDALNVAVGSTLVPVAVAYQPRLGVPIYGEGIRLDKIMVPGLAQRVDVDLRGERRGMTLAYLTPAEARYAMSSTAALMQTIERERAETESGRLNGDPAR